MKPHQKEQDQMDVNEIWELAYKRSTMDAPSEQANFLLRSVGPRIATIALGLADARQIKAWARGEATPREHAVGLKLALLYRVAYAIVAMYGGSVAALFLRSSNPQLDDEVPIKLLREGDADHVQGRLLAATRAFLDG